MFLFANCALDADRRELRRDGALLAVEPQVFDLLVYLINQRERVVSRDDLLAVVWGGRIVSESALSTRINAARAAVGDNGEAQRVIRTVPRKGFRFVATVQDGAAAAPAAAAIAAPAAPAIAAEPTSVAVLPFINMSGDAAREALADGITEDILTALVQQRGLHVVARNSSFVYKGQAVSVRQAAAALGARYILEGSIRVAGGKLRITGQLIEAETDRHLWADRYDCDADAVAAQDQITQRIATAIREAILGSAEPAAAAAPEAPERRQLTVLACELVTPAAGRRLGLDDLRAASAAFQRRVAAAVGRFDGRVAGATGGTALAYFGYPEAHEDDAERAVAVGLALAADAEPLLPGSDARLTARVGIATGLVIVGDPQDGIVGDPPGLAARLQALAPPGAVAIEPATRRLLGNLFDYRELGPVAGGGAAPVTASEVLGAGAVESRFAALHAAELTPLLGRDEELELLTRRWQQAKGGHGRVVLLSGEPGIGKSRLAQAIQELALQELAAGAPHARLRYLCSPQHSHSAMFPIIDQLERAAGFARGDSGLQKRAKLQTVLAPAGAEAAPALELLAELMSLPPAVDAATELTPEKRKEKTLAALLAWLEGRARQQPVLVIAEDLHWIDPSSLELLAMVVERIAELPVLVVMTFRPEFQAPWVGQPHVTQLSLNRLDPRDGAALAQKVAGSRQLPGRLVSAIVARSDGVPLFVEEITKAMLEAADDDVAAALDSGPGSETPGVPAALHASLLARLDRLGAAKRLAQIGATIGREFSYELLAAVAGGGAAELDADLARLVESGLVFRRGLPPQAVLLFKHALVQDTAYGTLLREPRRELHARIAQALIERFPAMAETAPEIIAHHCTEAGLTEQASEFWGRAGERSVARSALVEAAVQLGHAQRLIATLPGTPALRRRQLRLQVALANVLMHVRGYASAEANTAFEQAAAMLEAADALGEPPDDPLLRFSVLYGQWSMQFVTSEVEEVPPLATQFLDRAQHSNSSAAILLGHRLVGTSLLMLGHFAPARQHLDRAIALYDPVEHRPLAVQFAQDLGIAAMSHRAWALWHLGFADAARRDIDDAHAQAAALGQANTLLYVLAHGTVPEILLGRLDGAEAHARQLISIAEDKGGPTWRALGRILLGWTLSLTGFDGEAATLLEAGLAEWSDGWMTVFNPMFLAALARAQHRLGQVERARDSIAQALARLRRNKKRWAEAEVHRIAGELAPDERAAEACFQQSLATARSQSARAVELRAATSLARLWRGKRKAKAARELLAPVRARFTEGLATPDLRDADALLAELAGQR